MWQAKSRETFSSGIAADFRSKNLNSPCPRQIASYPHINWSKRIGRSISHFRILSRQNIYLLFLRGTFHDTIQMLGHILIYYLYIIARSLTRKIHLIKYFWLDQEYFSLHAFEYSLSFVGNASTLLLLSCISLMFPSGNKVFHRRIDSIQIFSIEYIFCVESLDIRKDQSNKNELLSKFLGVKFHPRWAESGNISLEATIKMPCTQNQR